MSQINYRHILLTLGLFLFTLISFAQDPPVKKPLEQPVKRDTLGVKNDSIPPIVLSQDSIQTDTTLQKQPFLLDKITYKAKDYTKISRKEKKIYLYNEAELYYQDTELKAGIIVLDYSKNEVYAGRIKDTAGVLTQYPYFKQGNDVIEPDSIRFNFDTKKALIWNSRTTQQDFNVFGEVTKKENDSVIFIKNAKFTTAKDLDDPEYYFYARRIKMVPKKKIITGLTNMYIANVPTPIGLPFAYFPLNNEKSVSGIIMPTPGESGSRGYFLQNGGYYLAINDYVDLAILGDYFTNGSYGLRLDSKYSLRYKFRGNINFRFENQINSQRGFPDFSKSTIYNIRWSHSKDAKSNPNSTFSASVNLGSSTYYQQSINQLNAINNINNNLSSSISYSKRFTGYPAVNLSLTATHSQNANTESINLTLPSLQTSVERIYPFAKRDGLKKGIIKNINFQYNLRGENRIATTDSLFFKKEMFDDAKIGAQHSLPISTNFKLFKHFSISMGGNYEESWTLKTTSRSDYDTMGTTDLSDDIASIKDTISGFDAFRKYSFGASLGTTIYGTFDFGEDKKIQAIRHVMRPSVSYSISPSFEQFYDEYISDADGNTTQYTRFEDALFGSPGLNRSSSIGFSLSNTIEAKVRDRDSTATESKKITILNNLNFSTSYNIAADSLEWSPLRMSGSTAFFDKKMSVNFNATFDPYAIDNNGTRINTFNIDNNGSLFRMTNAGLNLSYSLSNKKSGKGKDEDRFSNTDAGGRDDDLFGQNIDFRDRLEEEDEEDKEELDNEFYETKVPWNLRLGYSMTYSNSNRQNEISNNSLMFSGDINLSPKWKVGGSSGYDFKNGGITNTSLRFNRDLDSWRLDFSWYPFNTNTSWNFFIGIKSGVLSDIKWEKRREPDRRL